MSAARAVLPGVLARGKGYLVVTASAARPYRALAATGAAKQRSSRWPMALDEPRRRPAGVVRVSPGAEPPMTGAGGEEHSELTRRTAVADGVSSPGGGGGGAGGYGRERSSSCASRGGRRPAPPGRGPRMRRCGDAQGRGASLKERRTWHGRPAGPDPPAQGEVQHASCTPPSASRRRASLTLVRGIGASMRTIGGHRPAPRAPGPGPLTASSGSCSPCRPKIVSLPLRI